MGDRWWIENTLSGAWGVFGSGEKRTTPFGTEYDMPICACRSEADARMIADALNAASPQMQGRAGT